MAVGWDFAEVSHHCSAWVGVAHSVTDRNAVVVCLGRGRGRLLRCGPVATVRVGLLARPALQVGPYRSHL